MERKTTVVRATSNRARLKQCTAFQSLPTFRLDDFLEHLGGKPVKVLLPPLDSPKNRVQPPCQSAHFWKVAPEEAKRLGMSNAAEVFLCEHMVDVD